MSLLLDAPRSTATSARQLGFDWLNEVAVETAVVAKSVVQKSAVQKSAVAQHSATKPIAAAQKVFTTSTQVATGSKARLGEPQKLGAAMLKLLKRYGITDAEIEAGMEAYAQRMASR